MRVSLMELMHLDSEDPQPDNVDEAGDDPSENGFQKEYLKSIRDRIVRELEEPGACPKCYREGTF